MIEWAFTNFCCGANIKDTLISRSGFEEPLNLLRACGAACCVTPLNITTNVLINSKILKNDTLYI